MGIAITPSALDDSSFTAIARLAVIDTGDNTIADSITVGLFSSVVATQAARSHGDDDRGDHEGIYDH